MKAKIPEEATSNCIREKIAYCPTSGKLKWKLKSQTGLPAGRNCGRIRKDGYVGFTISHDKKVHSFMAHRVAWFLAFGSWPDGEIDHINSDKADNRIENLRVATRSQNMCHTKVRKNNSSGIKGITLHKKINKWEAKIMIDGKYHYLGVYKTPEEAHLAYSEAAKKLHGEFHSVE